MLRSIGKQSAGNTWSQSRGRKGRLRWEGFVEMEGVSVADVARSVCALVTTMSLAKAAEAIETPAIVFTGLMQEYCSRVVHGPSFV